MLSYLKTHANVLIIVFLFFIMRGYASADIINTIRSKIYDTNNEIERIEAEIQNYQKELEVIGTEKKTLQTEISRLNLSAKKLGADISLTENKIYTTNLSINNLQEKIEEKEKSISKNKKALLQSIRSIQLQDDVSIIEAMLSHNKLTDFWSTVDTLETFQISLKDNIKNLQILRNGLEQNKSDELANKNQLASLKVSLQDQKQIVEYNKSEKDTILSITKNEEGKYQEYLQNAEERRKEFEKELSQLEADLKIAIDPSSIPRSGKGILSWPLDKIIITQKFGNTAFAQSGAYNGSGHNGIDFSVPTGTSVRAVSSGVVEAIGNTDSIRGCYSYGKWVLIKHSTGLSSLYAHLSVIKVSPGEFVATGDTVAYSGNSGYSTGPHLHLSIYASQGVQVVRLGDIKKITNCADARIPVAPFEAYLNPLDYL